MPKKTKLLYYSFWTIILSVLILNSFTPLVGAGETKPVSNQVLSELGDAAKAIGYSESEPAVPFAEALIYIVNVLLGFVGIVFFILLIYGGYLWMNARGNEEQVAKAKKIIQEVVIGLIIILIARLFTEFLLIQFGKAADANV